MRRVRLILPPSKKSIEFYITLEKEQESVGDVKMDG